MKSILGKLDRLERRFRPPEIRTFSARILFIHPQEGVKKVLVMETGKPNIEVEPTPEEVEEVRADLERRQAASLQWSRGAN